MYRVCAMVAVCAALIGTTATAAFSDDDVEVKKKKIRIVIDRKDAEVVVEPGNTKKRTVAHPDDPAEALERLFELLGDDAEGADHLDALRELLKHAGGGSEVVIHEQQPIVLWDMEVEDADDVPLPLRKHLRAFIERHSHGDGIELDHQDLDWRELPDMPELPESLREWLRGRRGTDRPVRRGPRGPRVLTHRFGNERGAGARGVARRLHALEDRIGRLERMVEKIADKLGVEDEAPRTRRREHARNPFGMGGREALRKRFEDATDDAQEKREDAGPAWREIQKLLEGLGESTDDDDDDGDTTTRSRTRIKIVTPDGTTEFDGTPGEVSKKLEDVLKRLEEMTRKSNGAAK